MDGATGAAEAAGKTAPHIVLIPFLTPGHIIPMADLGRLLAKRGARVSLVTTPLNASRLRPSFDRSKASGLPLHLVSIPFPSAQVGLPEGNECCDAISGASFIQMGSKLLRAVRLLQEPLKAFMDSEGATCLIADFSLPWTRDVAREVGVPWYVFYSVCCFTLYCLRVLPAHFEAEKLEDQFKPVGVPGVPDRIELSKAQARGFYYGAPASFLAEIAEAVAAADGIVVNSFHELEPDYLQLYRKETGKNVFAVGPVSLCNRESVDRAARAEGPGQPPSAAADRQRIMEWLDSRAPRSVVYACLGSLVVEHPRQIEEIGAGLEATGRPFLWVVKAGDRGDEVEPCLAGLERRSEGNCLIIRGWVPQLAILSHPSIGCFLSHCGWNSIAEAVAEGVPVATWPCFADQFVNAKFAVDVARVGVPVVGCERPLAAWWGGDEAGRRMVGREEVTAAVRRLSDGGKEAEGRRARVLDLADKAGKALENGGSSDVNLTALIKDSLRLAKG